MITINMKSLLTILLLVIIFNQNGYSKSKNASKDSNIGKSFCFVNESTPIWSIKSMSTSDTGHIIADDNKKWSVDDEKDVFIIDTVMGSYYRIEQDKQKYLILKTDLAKGCKLAKQAIWSWSEGTIVLPIRYGFPHKSWQPSLNLGGVFGRAYNSKNGHWHFGLYLGIALTANSNTADNSINNKGVYTGSVNLLASYECIQLVVDYGGDYLGGNILHIGNSFVGFGLGAAIFNKSSK